jgi:RNA polymerase sigma-70 factor (ECF subfamily)
LYARANASRWHLDKSRFRDALERAATKALGDAQPDPAAVDRFCAALRLEDLALACACAAGDEDAWQHFIVTYRPAMYRAADAIDPTGAARDLADGLYADLFGVTEKGGVRAVSLFHYFHGRSSLATWLRAVLAQRHVDRIRERKLVEPLVDDDATGGGAAARPAGIPDPDRDRRVALLHACLSKATACLAPRDRLRLACYYARHLTLAQIGRLTGEHEATVSRQLSRTRAAIRQSVERQLRDDHGMGQAEIEECFDQAVEDPVSLDLAALLGVEGDRSKESPLDRSKRGTQT